MKYVKLIITLVLVSLIFCGCKNFKLASSLDDLIAPVSPSGEDAEIQNAMDSYCKGGFTIKIPYYGKYTTSYIYFDFNGDGVKEAIAFYEPTDNLGKIFMAVLENYSGNKWNIVANIEGDGTDVYSVDFSDINGDGAAELLISWDVISNSSSHVLVAYCQYVDEKNTLKILKIADEITYDSYIILDMNNDGINEVLAFAIDQSKPVTSTAQLYSLKDNKKSLLSETRVDGHILSYKNISIGQADGQMAVYADAIKSNGTTMVTEIIYWSNQYESIISPFYSYDTGLTASTTRDVMISSSDINGDKSIEIPKNLSYKNIPDEVYAVDWQVYKKSTLVHSQYSFSVVDDGYQVIIPDEDFKNLSVEYNSKNKLLTVLTKKNKQSVFSVTPVLKSHYDDNKTAYDDYTVVLDKSGYIYLAKTFNNSKLTYTYDELKKMIKTC